MAMFTKWCITATFARRSSSDVFYVTAEKRTTAALWNKEDNSAATGKGMAQNPRKRLRNVSVSHGTAKKRHVQQKD